MNSVFAVFEPEGVDTTTEIDPAELEAGVFTVMVVSFTTVTLLAFTPPNFTPVAPVKYCPVIVTGCPPDTVPAEREMDAIVGAGGI